MQEYICYVIAGRPLMPEAIVQENARKADRAQESTRLSVDQRFQKIIQNRSTGVIEVGKIIADEINRNAEGPDACADCQGEKQAAIRPVFIRRNGKVRYWCSSPAQKNDCKKQDGYRLHYIQTASGCLSQSG